MEAERYFGKERNKICLRQKPLIIKNLTLKDVRYVKG